MTSSFDQDIILNRGYQYTTNASLSSSLANKRLTRATIEMVKLKGKKVLDVGCGDGTYTYKLFRESQPKTITGIDISNKAIALASRRYKQKGLNFFCSDIFSLSKKKEQFDCAILRGVLHHLDNPKKAIAAIGEEVNEVIILEPNGYNPILKIIEKVSPYHVTHHEKSYFPFKLNQWLKSADFKIISSQYISLIPFFTIDQLAIMLKKLEPFVENTIFIRNIICGVYVVSARKKKYGKT